MKNYLLVLLVLIIATSGFADVPEWDLQHDFEDSCFVFVPSLRGLPPMVEVDNYSDPIYYYDFVISGWRTANGSGGNSDLRIMGTLGIFSFAGALSIGSYSDGVWRWTPSGSPTVETYFYRPSFLDVFPDGSVWITGSSGSLNNVSIKYPDSSGWSLLSEDFQDKGPMTSIIVSQDSIYVLCNCYLAMSFDGGYNWDFVLDEIFMTDTYSPSDMCHDAENDRLFFSTWGGVIASDMGGRHVLTDAGCGYGGRDIEITEYDGDDYLAVLKNDNSISAKYLSGTSWHNWSSGLPSTRIIGFGKCQNKTMVANAVGEIYISTVPTGKHENVEKPDKKVLNAYPNPFNSSVKIETNPNMKISVFDIKGKLIYSNYCDESGMLTWTPEREQGSGIYYISLHLRDENSMIAKEKVIFLK